MSPADDHLDPERRARVEIDRRLDAAGWVVQDYRAADLGAAHGVAVREVVLDRGFGVADYVLFVDRRAVGVIEAKKEGTPLIGVEWQSERYTRGFPSAYAAIGRPLPFAYESTGWETRFTNGWDPEPASRPVFWFHRPETLADWCRRWEADFDLPTFRSRLRKPPPLATEGMRPAQIEAVHNLERSLADNRPRALIQMATGSGKTFTAANITYRLLKHGGARRVLFLVDRSNLGRQTLREFQSFVTPDDGRKLAELYPVEHLRSNVLGESSTVVITTIQRLFSMLKGDEDIPEDLEETSTFVLTPDAPVEVDYQPALPIEQFDAIIIDECHRSIYGQWRQVLEYFDAFLIGLTATPGKQTLGFFNQNLVMEYDHEAAVADNVNVDFDVFRISTEITERGSKIDAGLVTTFRDRQTRRQRHEKLDDDLVYDERKLDREVVAKDQIRTIVRAFKQALPSLFPDREHVPKTLVFAKDDNHAEEITEILREEFGKGRDFAAKITYRSTGQKPEELLQSFRNQYFPRVAVTVDMIATGTDVKPIEIVFFMRMVRSRGFFEQMKGRGVRTINATDLQAVTPDALGKDRFVLIDAVGVTEADLHDTVPLEREPTVSFERLLQRVAFGERSRDLVSSIAARITRLDKRITKEDRDALEEVAGTSLSTITHVLLDALDPDRHLEESDRTGEDVAVVADHMIDQAVRIFDNGALRDRLVVVKASYEMAIDEFSKDTVTRAEFSVDATDRAHRTIDSFREYIEQNKDEITALQVLYNRPYGQRLRFRDVKELATTIERPPRGWTPDRLWQAYETLDKSKVHGSGTRVLTDIVSLVRFALEQENELVPFPDKVDERFQAWLLAQENAGKTFTDEQNRWLTDIKDHVAASLAITTDDLDSIPFVQHGGLGRAFELFGADLVPLLDELTETLAA